MVIRQLPVNSSAPVKTTVIRPKGKSRPLARRAREGEIREKDAVPAAAPPIPMRKPAKTANRNSRIPFAWTLPDPMGP